MDYNQSTDTVLFHDELDVGTLQIISNSEAKTKIKGKPAEVFGNKL